VNNTADGSYKLTSTVTSGSATYAWVEDSSGSSFSGDYNDLTNKPTLFSGNYNDLTNKPTIPTGETLPTAPAGDGTYLLKVSVSSGTPTYSWESVVIGGSY